MGEFFFQDKLGIRDKTTQPHDALCRLILRKRSHFDASIQIKRGSTSFKVVEIFLKTMSERIRKWWTLKKNCYLIEFSALFTHN